VRPEVSADYLELVFNSSRPLVAPESRPCSPPANRSLPWCPNSLSGLGARVLLDLTGGRGSERYQWDCTFAGMTRIRLSLPRFVRAGSARRALASWASDGKGGKEGR